MARYANLAYCSQKNNAGKGVKNAIAHVFVDMPTRDVIIYFGGPRLSIKQLEARKPTMVSFKSIYSEIPIPMVDAKWLKDVEQIYTILVAKLRAILELLETNRRNYRLPTDNFKIRFTGHGVGGVYAMLAALLLRLEVISERPINQIWPYVIIDVTTFGQPRFGDFGFATLLNRVFSDSVNRITHTNDFAPQLPVKGIGEIFLQQQDTEYWISRPLCDCPDERMAPPIDDQGYSALFRCYGFHRKKDWTKQYVWAGENNECNLGQHYAKPESENSHNGPYFGITMGVCTTGMDGASQVNSWAAVIDVNASSSSSSSKSTVMIFVPLKKKMCSKRLYANERIIMGFKAESLEIDSTGSISDDLVRRIELLEMFFRPFEILSLVPANELDQLKTFAWFGMRAYCLNEEYRITEGIFAGVAVQGNEIILIIRGEPLNSPQFWIENPKKLIAYPRSNYGAKVDEYFWNRYLETEQKLGTIILDRLRGRSNIQKIVAIGHGSGGVYATFQLLDLIYMQELKRMKFKVVTFGSPRIGNKEFVQQVNDLLDKIPVLRFTNIDDYVPRLPGATYPNYYVHHMSEYWIKGACDCNSLDVYLCIGRVSMTTFVQESEVCVNQFETHSFNAHNGPYLGVMMGSCSNEPAPTS
ncbi:hypothetical protein G9A89_009181 [Geosiphon pyriformis]|nr:hypothetical protein G9A89_009181 [Geosiphon pyriformis]